jgi:membrane protease YdiL (CAAX protease family)
MQNTATAVGQTLAVALLLGSGLVWLAVLRRLVSRQAPITFEPRSEVPWSGRDLLVLIVGYFVCEVAAATVLQQWMPASAAAPTPTTLIAQSAARVAWLVLAPWYLFARSGATLDDLGWNAREFWRDARLGVCVFLAASVPVFAVQGFFVHVMEMPSKHPALVLIEEQRDYLYLAAITLVVAGVAPLFEELVFRILLQGWLEAHQARLRAGRESAGTAHAGFAPLVIVSALFAALHGGHGPDPYAIFVLSLFLGYAYRQTHRIVPSLVAHACLNGWTMLNLWLMLVGGVK